MNVNVHDDTVPGSKQAYLQGIKEGKETADTCRQKYTWIAQLA